MKIPATQPYTTYQDEGDGIYTVRIHEAADPSTGKRQVSMTEISILILDMLLRALQSEGFVVVTP